MADNANKLQLQSDTANVGGRAAQGEMRRPPSATTEGDDSVFYSEEEDNPQQSLDSIWAPVSGEPIWPEKLDSAQIENSGVCSSRCSTAQMEARPEQTEIESKMENKVNNAWRTDADAHGETAVNNKITHSEKLSTPPPVPCRTSTLSGAVQIKETDNTNPDDGRSSSSSFLPDEAKEAGLSGIGRASLDDVEQEFLLDLACDSDGKPFDHLTHAKYGTVSYRKIQRGQTKKRIEMFESMTQL